MFAGNVSRFTETHPDFSAGYIACGLRFLQPEVVEKEAFGIYEAARVTPGVVMGYDLVSEEDGNPPNEIFNEGFARL